MCIASNFRASSCLTDETSIGTINMIRKEKYHATKTATVTIGCCVRQLPYWCSIPIVSANTEINSKANTIAAIQLAFSTYPKECWPQRIQRENCDTTKSRSNRWQTHIIMASSSFENQDTLCLWRIRRSMHAVIHHAEFHSSKLKSVSKVITTTRPWGIASDSG